MKKLLTAVLCLILVFSCCAAAAAEETQTGFGDYEHVFIIGVDGAGAASGATDSSRSNTRNTERVFFIAIPPNHISI